jgi:hypothetical protein
MITVNAYSDPSGGFLFFAQPASALQSASHGPLLSWGVVTADDTARPGVWERVDNDITQNGFARVSKALGRQLLGLDTQQQRASGLR